MQILDYKLEAYISYKVESIEEFLTFCEQVVENMTKDDKVRFKLKSSIHELITNSIEHGYKKNPGKITVSLRKEPDSIVFEVSDEGLGFDISKINFDRTFEDLDSTTSRGWGLLITNKLSKNIIISPNNPIGTKVTVIIPIQ